MFRSHLLHSVMEGLSSAPPFPFLLLLALYSMSTAACHSVHVYSCVMSQHNLCNVGIYSDRVTDITYVPDHKIKIFTRDI